jgi:hypothetical protein
MFTIVFYYCMFTIVFSLLYFYCCIYTPPPPPSQNQAGPAQDPWPKKSDFVWVSVLTKYRYFYIILEKGILPYWRQGIYDQLLSGIRDSLSNIFRFQNKSVNARTCPRVTGPQHTLIWIWNMKNLEIWFHISQILKKTLKMLTKILCRMAVTLFQTS